MAGLQRRQIGAKLAYTVVIITFRVKLSLIIKFNFIKYVFKGFLNIEKDKHHDFSIYIEFEETLEEYSSENI